MGFFSFCMFSVLETESTGSYMLGRCSATELFLHSCGGGQCSSVICLPLPWQRMLSCSTFKGESGH